MKSYINIHTHHFTDKNSLVIYNKNLDEQILDATYFSVGIHPWFIPQKKLTEQYQSLKKQLANSRCLALGECGLDKLTDTDFKLQITVFTQQLEINKTFKKPVIVHCVRSYQEFLAIQKQYSFSFIVHGFNKKQALANQLLKSGCYLSFGKHILEKESLQLVVKNTPLNRIFLETDDAKITIEKLYKKVAEIKEIPLENVILALQNNFKKVFLDAK